MDSLQSLLNLAYFYLKFRPRTVKEVRSYLYKKIKNKHWRRDDVEKAIKYLLEQRFLDDQKFIDYLVESRTKTKIKSVFVIKQELIKYGVEKELIDEYFAKTEINEEALAKKALAVRWSRLKTLPKQECFKKAVGFLVGRGFNFEISRKTVEKSFED